MDTLENNLQALNQARFDIRAAIVQKGGALAADAGLKDMSAAIAQISGGNVKETVVITLASDKSVEDDGLLGAEVNVYDEDNDDAVLGAYTWDGKPITLSIIPGVRYRVSAGAASGYLTPDAQSYVAKYENRRTITFSYALFYVSSITIDQTISDPATMVSGDIQGDAIKAIRANSHRYLGKYTAEGTQTICQLDDADGTKYADGSDAVLTGGEGDVWMRLPEFWWKVTNAETDKVTISFAYGGQPDETWKKWNPDQLIGVYHALNSDSKLYSRGGVTPTANVSQSTFRTYARNRGTGFSCVTWEWHNMMIALYLAMYGNMNSQETCGYGASSYGWATGGTSAMGMTDTTKDTGATDVGFWGIENWWSNLYEWVDNVSISNGIITVAAPADGTSRTVATQARNATGWVYSKRIITEDLDIFAGASQSGGSNTTGWCDGYYGNTGSRVVLRGGSSANAFYGVACVNACNTSSFTNADAGSRLSFTGTIVEEKDSETFKSLTQI